MTRALLLLPLWLEHDACSVLGSAELAACEARYVEDRARRVWNFMMGVFAGGNGKSRDLLGWLHSNDERAEPYLYADDATLRVPGCRCLVA